MNMDLVIRKVKTNFTCLVLIVTLVNVQAASVATPVLPMRCAYGERGSLTATCINATASFFKYTPYKFDNLDVTVKCINCTLNTLESGTFDLTGNAIQTLDLTRSNISIIKAQAFVGLMYLKNLLMPHNYIRSIYPGTFAGIKNVEYLDLQNNSIGLLADNAFKELVNLKHVNLKSNFIKHVQEHALSGLVNLREIFMENNQIENLTNVFSNNLPALYSVDISSNRINTLNQSDFINITTIVDLNLSNNMIVSIPANTFIYLKNLKVLDLSWNPINSILPGSFEGLQNLETLNLMNAMIVEIPLKTWQGLYNVNELTLAYNGILNFRSGMFSSLPELTKLNLSHNNIVTFEKTGVFSLTVHVLDLSFNNISSLDAISLITHMPKLSFFSLEHNPLNCDTVNQLQSVFGEENLKLALHIPDGCVVFGSPWNVEKIVGEEKVVVQAGEQSNVVVYVLLSFCFLLVVAVGLGQLYMYRQLRNGGLYDSSRYVSQTQLIRSTDLQANDPDYLRD